MTPRRWAIGTRQCSRQILLRQFHPWNETNTLSQNVEATYPVMRSYIPEEHRPQKMNNPFIIHKLYPHVEHSPAVLQAGQSWVAVSLLNSRHLLVQITKHACSSDIINWSHILDHGKKWRQSSRPTALHVRFTCPDTSQSTIAGVFPIVLKFRNAATTTSGAIRLSRSRKGLTTMSSNILAQPLTRKRTSYPPSRMAWGQSRSQVRLLWTMNTPSRIKHALPVYRILCKKRSVTCWCRGVHKTTSV